MTVIHQHSHNSDEDELSCDFCPTNFVLPTGRKLHLSKDLCENMRPGNAHVKSSRALRFSQGYSQPLSLSKLMISAEAVKQRGNKCSYLNSYKKQAKIWERPGEIGISRTEYFIGNASMRAQGHEIGRKLKKKCLLFRWLKCRVTWTLLLLLFLHILLLHHNKAAWMNEDQTAHFFFSGSAERGLHTTVVPPQRLQDSFIPRQVHWGDGVQGRCLLSSGLKRWLQSIPGAEEQCGVESLGSPTTLGCSPPTPL